MNDRIWRELIARVALVGLSFVLLTCSAGLFYVGYLNYRSGPSAAPGTETAWRLFAIAAALALGGAVLLKQSLLPARAEFE